MAFKTWAYKGKQAGRMTRAMVYGKTITLVQDVGPFDSHFVVFNRKQLRKLLKRHK